MKQFLVPAAKIAVGVTASTVMLATAAWTVITVRDAPLHTSREWPAITADALEKAEFHLRTVWHDWRLYYQLTMRGLPTGVEQAKDSRSQAAFTITFEDKDGFKLFEKSVHVASMTQVPVSDGAHVGLEWKGDESADGVLYRRAARWKVSWSGLPQVQADLPTPSDHGAGIQWAGYFVISSDGKSVFRWEGKGDNPPSSEDLAAFEKQVGWKPRVIRLSGETPPSAAELSGIRRHLLSDRK